MSTAESHADSNSASAVASAPSPQATTAPTTSEAPWHAAFPAPTLTAEVLPARKALMVLSLKIANMLLIDVRRTDYGGGAIRGSLNIPAQGFWWNRGALYELAYKADMEWVVFTCGSSNGRGPRCAAWFLEHVRNTAEDTHMQVMVLEGGVKGWVKNGPEYIRFMDGFEEAHWVKLFEEEKKAKEKEEESKKAIESSAATTS